ncbi:nitrilase-related carbon-nitrogen hydrolase [Rhodococcus opacus]|uniref:nitrilase-related carbon-nitrogen hydrolase n=1 Tax=Rhodococcus opacus TaxID=37919 RepID=UPI0034D2C1C9
MDTFPRFTAAAVQASPVYLDPDATVQKAVGLIHEAAAAGATLIAFPEVFVPGYPYWNWTMNPVKGGSGSNGCIGPPSTFPVHIWTPFVPLRQPPRPRL